MLRMGPRMGPQTAMNRLASKIPWRIGLLAGGLLVLILGLGWLMADRAQADAPVQSVAAADENHEILVLLRLPPAHFTPDSSYGGSYGDQAGAGARRRFALERAKANGLQLVDDWPMPMAGLDCYIMAVPADRSPEEAAAALSHDPGIEWAEPLRQYRAQGAATTVPPGSADPLYRVQPDAREWKLDALHRIATGRNVRVAIIDSAIEVGHPDLIGQVVVNENFAPGPAPAGEVHGTGVAGIIAAIDGNGKGIVGVAPRARLMGLRACRQTADAAVTLCDSLSLAKALYFAVDHKAEIINMSLSGPPDPLLGRLIDLAETRGITIVGAFDRSLPGGGFPASHTGVVAVIDEADSHTDTRVLGAPIFGTPIFGAPGRDIPTTQPGGNWFFVNGSSYAAAHVSGLFALMRERSGKPSLASALATFPSSDTVDPCATLSRIVSGGCGPSALALQGGALPEARP